MAGQRGRDMLLKVADGAGGYETLAGIRASKVKLAQAMVDATHAGSADAWRELLAGAGVKSAQVSGRGVFKDAASDARMRALFFGGELADWRLVLPDFGILAGAFLIRELTWDGAYDGEMTFAVTLESAGQVSFEVAA